MQKRIPIVILAMIAAMGAISCSKKSTASAQSKDAMFVEIYAVAYGNENAAGAGEYRKRIPAEWLQTLKDYQLLSCNITKNDQAHDMQFEKLKAGGFLYSIGQRDRSTHDYQSFIQGWTSLPELPEEIARVFIDGSSPYRVFLSWNKKELEDRMRRERNELPIDCVIHTPN
ncbi:MAG: hypothetical protein Q8Q39_03010 [bacterium]|nr:hypothetical protein [bacterium]